MDRIGWGEIALGGIAWDAIAWMRLHRMGWDCIDGVGWDGI